MNYKLRRLTTDDAYSLARYANNKRIFDRVRDQFPYPYTEADARDFIRMCGALNLIDNIQLTIDVGGEAVGMIGLTRKDDVYRKSAEIGYWLGEPFWGHGIVTKAVRDVCALGFREIDIVRIYAEVFDSNTASQRVLEKAGFWQEGRLRSAVCKNDRIMDCLIYGLLKP